MSARHIACPLVLAAAVLTGIAAAQTPPDPGPLLATQREAMAALQSMKGVWRGSAWTVSPSGESHTIAGGAMGRR